MKDEYIFKRKNEKEKKTFQQDKEKTKMSINLLSDIVCLHKIHPCLFLASLQGARQQTGKIAHVCVASDATCRYQKDHDSDYRATILVDDTTQMGEETFQRKFDKAAYCIHKCLTYEKQTVVHCYAGINRSVTSILRYVQLYRPELDWQKCLLYIRRINQNSRRTHAMTNWRFEELLQKLSKTPSCFNISTNGKKSKLNQRNAEQSNARRQIQKVRRRRIRGQKRRK